MPNNMTFEQLQEKVCKEVEAARPVEMNHAEVADWLEDMALDEMPIYSEKIAALRQAAADERRIANGELAEVVHARWISNCICSHCEAISPGLVHKAFCPSCGALMDEARGRNNDYGERKDGAK